MDRAKAQAVLGLVGTPTEADVESAFRKKARQWHPDRNTGVTDEVRELVLEKMKELNEAREFLLRLVRSGGIEDLEPGPSTGDPQRDAPNDSTQVDDDELLFAMKQAAALQQWEMVITIALQIADHSKRQESLQAAKVHLANAYLETNQLRQAVSAAEIATAHDPEDSLAWIVLANCRKKQGRARDSRDALTEAIDNLKHLRLTEFEAASLRSMLIEQRRQLDVVLTQELSASRLATMALDGNCPICARTGCFIDGVCRKCGYKPDARAAAAAATKAVKKAAAKKWKEWTAEPEPRKTERRRPPKEEESAGQFMAGCALILFLLGLYLMIMALYKVFFANGA